MTLPHRLCLWFPLCELSPPPFTRLRTNVKPLETVPEKKNRFSINSNNKHHSVDYTEGVDGKILRNVGIRNKLPVNTASR